MALFNLQRAVKECILELETPDWLFDTFMNEFGHILPSRYKMADGGRGCVHPDTLLNTPNGDIKISEFQGGEIYSLLNGKVITTYATKPKEYTKEDLYKVTTNKGLEIICTDEHKFLTPNGWKMLKEIDINSFLVCEQNQEFSVLLQTNSEHNLYELHEDALNYSKKHVDCQDDYLLYQHQYDQQLLSSKDIFQAFPPLLIDEEQHNIHASFHLGDLEFSDICILSLVCDHLSSFGALPFSEGRSYTCQESYIYDISFELPLESFQQSQKFHESNNLEMQARIPEELFQASSHSTHQEQILETIHCKQSFFFHDNSFYLPSIDLSSDTSIQQIKSIRKHCHLKYWDIHVPLTNCYFANGFLNHNSGKSHGFGDMLTDKHIEDPDYCSVCIREIQKSLKFSAKKLIEDKIKAKGVSHLFDIQETQIKRIGGDGIIIFMGMQDHTADSIKSLEGFDLAWVEEAQSLSKRSLDLLLPTIRKTGSELWFTWNPYLDTDAVDQLLKSLEGDDDLLYTRVNYLDNPFLPEELEKEAERSRITDPDNYGNIWLGEHMSRTDDQIFGKKWLHGDHDEDIENNPSDWDGPYYGMDFGHAEDPSTAVEVWFKDKDVIYIRKEAGGQHIDYDELARVVCKGITGIEDHVVRGDCASPGIIAGLKKRPKHCDDERKTEAEDFYLPKIVPCVKWSGSVNDGIAFMNSFKQIVVHPDCKETAKEMRLYKWKKNKGGDILTVPIDKHNHYMDAIRYASGPLIDHKGETTDWSGFINKHKG